MSENKIKSLYDHYKNTSKKLKIVCDWDEVIQSAYPYAYWLGRKEQRKNKNTTYCVPFVDFFDSYWHGGERDYYRTSNPSDIYHQMPFLTIAEDLLRLIKEDKVEELIFLSTSDDRKYEVFKETFLKLRKIDKVCLRMMTDEPRYRTKAEWIKHNAPNFDIFIDDDPENCRDVIELKWELHRDECEGCAGNFCSNYKGNMRILSPYYPAIEKQHDERVIFIKQEVSNLKKEDFAK